MWTDYFTGVQAFRFAFFIALIAWFEQFNSKRAQRKEYETEIDNLNASNTRLQQQIDDLIQKQARIDKAREHA